jgi:nitroreductase
MSWRALTSIGKLLVTVHIAIILKVRKMKDDLYTAIFKRRSIRNYDLTPLNQNLLDEISENLRSLKPMTASIKTEFKIISPDQVKRAMKKAPYYIAAFSEAKDAYKANVGFMLQQMDLYFSSTGLGSCWLGIAVPTEEVIESSNLEYVILMSFGNSTETLHRTSVSEFKRKPLSEITDIKGADELLEPARLAPSAINRQNWYFTSTKNMIQAYSLKPSFLGNLLGGKFYPINVGIAICHLQIAAEHFGRKARIVSEEEREKNPQKGREYIASLEIEPPPTKESA